MDIIRIYISSLMPSLPIIATRLLEGFYLVNVLKEMKNKNQCLPGFGT